MTLVERGKIQLDRPANDYLGRGKMTGYAADAREATVERVMSHTAGLPLHYRVSRTRATCAAPSSRR